MKKVVAFAAGALVVLSGCTLQTPEPAAKSESAWDAANAIAAEVGNVVNIEWTGSGFDSDLPISIGISPSVDGTGQDVRRKAVANLEALGMNVDGRCLQEDRDGRIACRIDGVGKIVFTPDEVRVKVNAGSLIG